MKLTDVSKTALATLRSRVIESGKENPLIKDPMGTLFLEKLTELASEEEKMQLFNRKLPTSLTNYIALRSRKYDHIVDTYIAENPSCTVINLGCGFDTRFWRINNEQCTYIELDLPEVVAVKKALLKDHLHYEIIGCSVLDPSWIEELGTKSNRNVLFLAEGLFMYLPRPDVIQWFKAITDRFRQSQIVFEVVTEKYTHGIWKKIVEMKIKRLLRLKAGSSYNFGIKNAGEIESYANGLKVINEWSYVEDPDVRPRIMKYMGISRTQWTITAAIN